MKVDQQSARVWQEWSDEYGKCYVSMPFVIRELVGNGRRMWRLDGGGITPEDAADPELLKLSAEAYSCRGVAPVRQPAPKRPPVADYRRYAEELRDVQSSVRQLSAIISRVNPLDHNTILGSRRALENTRDELQYIIDQLP